MSDFTAIFNEATEAATAAILAKFHSGDREQPFNCGFAWVVIDGRDPLVRWCRKKISDAMQGGASPREVRQYGDKGYPKGWDFWKPGEWPTKETMGFTIYGQDMDFHAAGARAFADVLTRHGHKAVVRTRLD